MGSATGPAAAEGARHYGLTVMHGNKSTDRSRRACGFFTDATTRRVATRLTYISGLFERT